MAGSSFPDPERVRLSKAPDTVRGCITGLSEATAICHLKKFFDIL
jgi:hypothetical protein